MKLFLLCLICSSAFLHGQSVLEFPEHLLSLLQDEILLFGDEGWTLLPGYDRDLYMEWVERELLWIFGDQPTVVPLFVFGQYYSYHTGYIFPVPPGEMLEEVLVLLDWVQLRWGPPSTILFDYHHNLAAPPPREWYESDVAYSTESNPGSSAGSSVNLNEIHWPELGSESESDEDPEAGLQDLYGPGFIAWLAPDSASDGEDSAPEEEEPALSLPHPHTGHECVATDVYGCPFVRDVLLGLVDYPLELVLPPGCLLNLAQICMDVGLDAGALAIRLVPATHLIEFSASRVPAPAHQLPECCYLSDDSDSSSGGVSDGAMEARAQGEDGGPEPPTSTQNPNLPVIIVTDSEPIGHLGELQPYSYWVLWDFLEYCQLP